MTFLTDPHCPWPTCLSNLASQRIHSTGVPEPGPNQGRRIFFWGGGHELKYSKSFRLPWQLTFQACCSKKVNSLHTCRGATGGGQPRASLHSSVCKVLAPGILGFTLPPPGPDGQANGCAGKYWAIDSTVTEHHPVNDTAMKCFSNPERVAFGCWTTGRNLLVGSAAEMKRLSGAGPWKPRLLKKPQSWSLAEWRKIVMAQLGVAKRRREEEGCCFQNCLNPSST